MSLEVSEMIDDEVLEEIYDNFFDREEYGDFQVADRYFRSVDPETFLEENINKNTKKKTESDMKLFLSFLMAKNDTRHPEVIPPDQLNTLMSQFVLGVTKKDGSEYEPTTIRGFVSSIDRYLKSKNSGVSVFNDVEFTQLRAVLTKKQQQLKRLGYGNKPKTAETLTEAHINKMIEAGTLGDKTPKSLVHSLWLICTSYFGMRTGKECHDLCWGDIQLGIDETSGERYLVYDIERQTKTRSGSNPRDTRVVKPKAFENLEDKQRDPVYLYNLYKSKRPSTMLQDDSPFFLVPAAKQHKGWYKNCPMGLNSIYGIMNAMKEGAGVENPRITPYSSRKRLVQTLQDQGIPANQIAQISGHKNVNSINNYSRINNDQAKDISSILSNNRTTDLPLPVQTATISKSPINQTSGGFPSGLFPNCHFHGPVTVNFSSHVCETQNLSQMPSVTVNKVTATVTGQSSPESSPFAERPFKRIRQISDTD